MKNNNLYIALLVLLLVCVVILFYRFKKENFTGKIGRNDLVVTIIFNNKKYQYLANTLDDGKVKHVEESIENDKTKKTYIIDKCGEFDKAKFFCGMPNYVWLYNYNGQTVTLEANRPITLYHGAQSPRYSYGGHVKRIKDKGDPYEDLYYASGNYYHNVNTKYYYPLPDGANVKGEVVNNNEVVFTLS